MNFKNQLGTIFIVIVSFINQEVHAKGAVSCVKLGSEWKCHYIENGNCPKPGYRPMGEDNLESYCENVGIIQSSPPIIRTLKDGRAFLDNNGQVIQISSDKYKRFFENIGKKTKNEIVKFLNNDDGVVSQKRLEIIAKELGAKIETSTKLVKTNYCPPCRDKGTKEKKQNVKLGVRKEQ